MIFESRELISLAADSPASVKVLIEAFRDSICDSYSSVVRGMSSSGMLHHVSKFVKPTVYHLGVKVRAIEPSTWRTSPWLEAKVGRRRNL